ncbi:MAG: Asp-tRNA(Asn)/Glu-tRNA(Gln) amidotransferase subunit GatA [candidate division SR1 bacterium]|nr:Asp-tRNA(Asn)/Glu-tRNA(Gln) amidotransferase subunit GatA [candidate division SR1 bacterium]
MAINLPINPTIFDIQNLYLSKQATVTEVVDYFYAQIELKDKAIKSVVRLNTDLAFRLASDLDKYILDKNDAEIKKILGQKKLFGIPFAMKDNILVSDEIVTGQSQILDGYKAVYSSDVYSLLVNQGAILIAQTNMDEFAFGSSTEFSGFGQITHNPADIDRVPGGTSGGSAAMVASGQVPFAIGTDTGGSIRQPASFCGIYGIRPTYGTVSRWGIMASTSSFDQAGPLANNLADIQLILDILQQKSLRDQTSTDIKNLNSDKKPIIGIPINYFGKGLSAEVRDLFENTIEKLREKYEVRNISMKTTEYALSVYYILQTVEASANLERYDGVRYGKQVTNGPLFSGSRDSYFGDESKRRIMLGTYTSSAGYYDAYYNKACQVRELIRRDFERVFEEVDVLLMPTSPFPAFKIGQNSNDPMAMYLADIMTVSHPIAKIPGLIVPLGNVSFEGASLPVGAQLVSKEFGEEILFKVGEELAKIIN